MIREVITRPHPLLRKQAVLVQPEEIPQLGPLLQDLFDTLRAQGGVGLAACQIGSDKNLFVASVEGKDHVFINPVVINASDEIDSQPEGCLSLPGVVLKVPRSKQIKAMYRDASGTQQMHDFADGWARIFLHEFDHLQGVMIDDRVGPVARMMARKKAAKRAKLQSRNEVSS